MKKFLPIIFMICLLCGGCMEVRTGSYEVISAETVQGGAVAVLASFESGLDDFIAENHDDYFWYMNAEDYNSLMDDFYGTYDGVGITMLFSPDEEYPLISEVNKNSPAYEQGICVGEYIKEVNGEKLIGLNSAEISGRIKGKPGTEVVLTIIGRDGKERQVALTRREIQLQSVDKRDIEGYPQIACISVTSFAENTPSEFKTLWKEQDFGSKAEALILDLRNNGGGSLQAAVELAGFFLPKGETVLINKSKSGLEETKSPGNVIVDVPVIILQNEYSASASEVFIGALRDHGLAQTVGTVSFGKGITQLIVPLFSGGAYRYTATMYYTPSMFALHGIGLEPDYEVELNADCSYLDMDAADMGKDNQLRTAVSLLVK